MLTPNHKKVTFCLAIKLTFVVHAMGHRRDYEVQLLLFRFRYLIFYLWNLIFSLNFSDVLLAK